MALKVIPSPAKINFLSYVGDVQGCGTIRIIFPHLLLPHIRNKNYNFVGFYSAYFIRQVDYYKNFTIVQFQRASTKAHLDLIKNFIQLVSNPLKTPLIYEIDDLLIDIPKWNYAADYYGSMRSYIEEILQMVHGITVSTDKLKEVYSKYNKNIEVIPNHLPKFIWGDITPKHLNTPREVKPRIFWAGSQNHFSMRREIKGGDFGKELLKFIRGTVDKYQWVIMGGYPSELDDLKHKIEKHDFVSIYMYPEYIKKLDVDFCIAPLMPGLFNECKSNIKMLEYTAIGCPAVYSKIEPYKTAYLQAPDDLVMIDMIEKLASDVGHRAEAWKKDHEAVKDQLWWEDNDLHNLKQYVLSYLKLFGLTVEI